MFLSIFASPIIRDDFKLSYNDNLDLINQFKLEEQSVAMTTNKYPLGSYTSFHTNTSVLDIPVLSELKKYIFESVNNLHQSIGLGGTLEFTSSWFSINRQYGYHEAHNHCPDIWSGVYYVKAEHGDATINFINKNLLDTGWPYNACKYAINDFNSTEKICTPTTGMFLIFPSYLSHKVEQQTIKSERISIAFNLNVKK
jgi:uncharacterized protein (TIGR02466 family)